MGTCRPGDRLLQPARRPFCPLPYECKWGGHTAPVTTGRGRRYSPAISPDGSKVAFTRAEGGNQNVWLMNRDGSGLNALTAVTGDAIEPVWSPDEPRSPMPGVWPAQIRSGTLS
jgi:dipeptidyl aminopeptidase/acylaminoacyl peptidase